MNGRVCGALVQFSCYQHKYKWMSSSPIYIRLSLEVTCTRVNSSMGIGTGNEALALYLSMTNKCMIHVHVHTQQLFQPTHIGIVQFLIVLSQSGHDVLQLAAWAWYHLKHSEKGVKIIGKMVPPSMEWFCKLQVLAIETITWLKIAMQHVQCPS